MMKNIPNLMQKAMACLLVLFMVDAKCNAQLVPPLWAVQPVGLSVQNGGTAVIAVAAVGTGINFTWYCNTNQQVVQSSNITILNTTTNTLLGIPLGGLVPVSILTIKNVNVTNASTYYVKAKSGIYTATSDNATLVVLSQVISPVINILSSATALTTAGFHLQMTTPVGSNVVVEASSDMVNWSPIYTNLNSSGSLSFTDSAATNHTSRYYRARTQ